MNGYKIVLLKAILCFIGCRKVNGYAPEYVTAGVGEHSYMNYLKVPAKIDEFCAILQAKQKTMGTFREQYELSFNVHLNLVTIHPWIDGNG